MEGDEQGTREAILEAAQRLFTDRGFEGTSTHAIVEASGTSKGSFYHYFSSKEDLYTAVLERMLDDVEEASFGDVDMQAIDRDSFWQLISMSARHSAEYMLANPDRLKLWRGFQESWRLIGDAGPARKLREKNLELGQQLAALGQKLGCIRTDLSPLECAQLVEAAQAVTDGWLFGLVDQHGGRGGFNRLSPVIVDLMWRMLAPPDDLHPGQSPALDGTTQVD